MILFGSDLDERGVLALVERVGWGIDELDGRLCCERLRVRLAVDNVSNETLEHTHEAVSFVSAVLFYAVPVTHGKPFSGPSSAFRI